MEATGKYCHMSDATRNIFAEIGSIMRRSAARQAESGAVPPQLGVGRSSEGNPRAVPPQSYSQSSEGNPRAIPPQYSQSYGQFSEDRPRAIPPQYSQSYGQFSEDRPRAIPPQYSQSYGQYSLEETLPPETLQRQRQAYEGFERQRTQDLSARAAEERARHEQARGKPNPRPRWDTAAKFEPETQPERKQERKPPRGDEEWDHFGESEARPPQARGEYGPSLSVKHFNLESFYARLNDGGPRAFSNTRFIEAFPRLYAKEVEARGGELPLYPTPQAWGTDDENVSFNFLNGSGKTRPKPGEEAISIAQLLSMDWRQQDDKHGWISNAFTNVQPSGVHPKAPLLTRQGADFIHTAYEFSEFLVLDYFLYHLGIRRMGDQYIVFNPSHMRNRLTKHDRQRLTRVLRNLNACGWHEESVQLFETIDPHCGDDCYSHSRFHWHQATIPRSPSEMFNGGLIGEAY
jgi:hypothetical protein